ncbi:MAG: alpha-2-macroglobulin family protein, partial [Candidatus Gracilibacteria bacterium]|nr:alpha-2-macroglobulin family protein [Candidatus Gracilibacteria bacterium]
MKSKNKIIMTILSFIMLFIIVFPNLKADLDPENIKNAQILADAGIIVDNSKTPKAYKLSDNISRREMLKIMLNIAGIKPDNICKGKFADLPASDWGCKYAETALKLGYIAANKNFRPNDSVSKTESLKMIFKAKNIEVSKTTDWRVGYVQKAVELGYTENFKDYDNKSLRSFVFGIGAKVVSSKLSNIKVSNVKEQISAYQKPKILLTFASNMNKLSVLSNIKVYPEIKYSSNWVDDKNLELVVEDLVKEDTDILVNVSDNATTSSGEKLENTFVKQFKISGEPLIDFTTPDGNITDLNQNITVRFSKPMVSLTNLQNQSKCPIEITPNIHGKCVWITTSTFQFRPEEGFPMGGKYSVNIPAGIQTISGDKTINSKSFEITTPDFALVSDIDSLRIDEKLNFVFNDEVDLDKFKINFKLNGISNDKLDFSYFKGEGDLEEQKNIISIFPKTGDWGYSKDYNYTISKNLTSSRGNIGLKNDISKSIITNSFLTSYSPVVFLDENAKEKYDLSNLKQSQNANTITKDNPSILLNFYENVNLDKNLFKSSLPFELNYVKITDYIQNKGSLVENKKQILITFSGSVFNDFSLKVLISQISSTQDETLSFSTQDNNKIIDYKQINYKKACLIVDKSIGNYAKNYKSFEFDKYGKVDYFYEINEWTKDKDCEYEKGKIKYILNTKLNPESDYKLTIKKSLLDNNNYPLDKDYIFNFSTSKALNEDKQVSIIDARNFILVPTDVKPLSISVQSINISQISAKVCNGDLDILQTNYITNKTCETKTIKLNNLGFKPNISVIDLEKVFGKSFDKKIVSLEISKLDEDKTEYEAKNDYYIQKASFVISDIGATIKTAKSNILWLHNYSSGENLTDNILKIENYNIQSQYSIFGAYIGEKSIFDKEISFTSKSDGIYELLDGYFSNLLITLKSGEKILLNDLNNYYSNPQNIYTYITTDKPIYKAGEKVNISGISKILNAKGYSVNTGEIQVYVTDAKYKEVFKKSVYLNSLGAFNVNFDLKNDANLGNYNITIGQNNLNFAVEEYQKPDFKVGTKSQNDSYLYGNNAKIDIEGEYYIGLPLSNGEGKYSLSSSEFYFDGGKTTGYDFGEQQNFWWNYGVKSIGYNNGNNNVEKTGNFVLNNDGKTTLNIPLETDIIDKVYNLSTTITDPNTKKSISSNTTFKAIRSKTFLGIKFDKYYYAYKDLANIGFVATDIDGNKLSLEDFDFKVYKVDYTYNENTYNYETKENLVLEKSIKTNNSGLAGENFSFDKYGEYRFEISNGNYKTTKTIYVSGGDLLRPIDAGNNIEILSDKDSYKIGEKAKIVISSPVVGVKALFTIEKLDEVLDYQIIDIDSFNKELSLNIKKEYLPNFNIGVYIIKDVSSSSGSLEELKSIRIKMLDLEQKLQKETNSDYIPYLIYDLSIFSNLVNNENLDTDLLAQLQPLRLQEKDLLNKILPQYFVGTKSLTVDLESVKLNSNIKLDKTTYLPGDSQTIELNITDNNGNLVNGETTISIIDESLLALKDNKTDIVNYFYDNKGVLVNTIGNLSNLIKRIEFNIEDNISSQQVDKFDSVDYGVSSSSMLGDSIMAPEMDDISKLKSEAVKKESISENSNASKLRTEFSDLAFYKTKVNVVNGKATLIVPALPDNLTTWVISGFAYTSDSKVGNFEDKFKVQKDLSILLQVPRFFISGDKAEISALIVNNTSSSKDVEVGFDMTNSNIIGDKNKIINVLANSS